MNLDYFKRLEFPIAAAATARGGPLVVYRVSGKNLSALLNELGLSPTDARKAIYKNILGIDQGLILYFKNPSSFTGEDVLEFHLHGSDRICESLIAALQKRNILEALPGEFSFRAYANGKLTLSEAESLHAALSAATSSKFSGELVNLSEKVQKKTREFLTELETALTSARGRLESAIDFSEATEEQSKDVSSCEEKLNILLQKLDQFLTTYQNFSLSLKEPRVLIVGEPNSGKSSLLNLLLGSERSLVSQNPGTTRDYIEAKVKIRNQNFVFVDTAGIRGLEGQELDDVEKRGIDRALEMIKEAHALLWVQASNKSENPQLKSRVEKHPLLIQIKSYGDLSRNPDAFDLRRDGQKLRSFLENELVDKILAKYQSAEKTLEFFLSERQLHLLSELQHFAQHSLLSLKAGRTLELVAEDLKLADKALKNCLGQELNNAYISEIFSQFCLGK